MIQKNNNETKEEKKDSEKIEAKPIVPPKSLIDKPQSLMQKMENIDNLLKNLNILSFFSGEGLP